jgi:hypothetical protein
LKSYVPFKSRVSFRDLEGDGAMEARQETSGSPIACTLDAGDYKERLVQIAELGRDALRSYERDGLVLRLRYDASYSDRVREMVRREQECCGFLSFETERAGEEIVVTVAAPAEASVAAEAMFDQFVTEGEPILADRHG